MATATAPGPWVEQWLSRPRFAPYLVECGQDRQRALDTYEWSMQLGQAVLRDTGHVEVGLRNAFDQALRCRWPHPTHWLLDPTSPVIAPLWRATHGRRLDVNIPNRRSINEATKAAGGASASPDTIIANLPFGFWRHMADTSHDRTVWVPYLQSIWPPPTTRSYVFHVMSLVNVARNRAAHLEPLHRGTPAGGILSVQQQLVNLLALLDADLAAHVQRTSTVSAILAARP